MNTILVLSIILACAEITAIYLLNRNGISFKGWRKVVFFCSGLLYGVCDVLTIFTHIGSGNVKIVLLILTCLLYLIFSKGKEIWGLAWFFCNILMFRSVCQLFKFIFLTIYCKIDMKLVSYYMENMTPVILVFYILFCIPGFFAARYIWGQFCLAGQELLKITGLIMLAIFFATDFLSEWVQILTTMPSVLLLFTLVNIWRIEYLNVREHKLGYYKQLEQQVEETDKELEEIRKEVEKFYRQANEEEHYSEQLLQKIDEVKRLK